MYNLNKIMSEYLSFELPKKPNEFQRSKIDYVEKYVLLCMYNKKNIVTI